MNKETECVEIHILFFFFWIRRSFLCLEDRVKDNNKTIKI